MSSIQLEHVRFSYRDHGQSFQALEDVSVTIGDGEFLCIVGRSGCGKTTLLRLMAGLQVPQSGRILIDGREVTGPDTDRAVVFQNYTLFPWMTALKNVQFGIHQARRELSRGEVRSIAMEFLEKVGMADFAGSYPYQLSGGMRQRVAIARALAMDTDILLLDEPFGALDARNRRELQMLLEQLWSSGSRRKTVIFVTHDIAEAVQLADRVLYMTPGRVDADLPVPLPRPRERLTGCEADRLQALRDQLLKLFYKDGGMEDAYETGL